MKKTIFLFLLSVVFSNLMAQNGQLLNRGFENWTNEVLYEMPSQWKSSNTDNPNFNNLVTKSSDAQNGSFSVKLKNADDNGNITFSYVYLGTIDNDGPSGGFPYTSNFNKVNGYYKCNMLTGDTGTMILVKFVGGNPIYDIGQFYGSVNSWTAFSFNITSGSADSIFFGFISSNPFGDNIGNIDSWLKVDNISFENTLGAAPAALPNPSFENWTSVSIENPDNWFSFNDFLSGMGLTPVVKSSPGNSGSFCVSMETMKINQDTISGFISVGEVNIQSNNDPFGKIPYTAIPTNGSFYYKYSPSGNDSGMVQLAFFKNGNPIAGWSQPIHASSSFQQATFNFNITESPDSMLLVFASGKKPDSKLYIDDISFTGGNVSVQNLLKKAGFNVYPNPTTDVLFIKADENISDNSTIEILDLNGKLFYSSIFNFSNNAVFEFQTNTLSSGIYYYRVINEQFVTTNKFIVQ